MIRHRRGNEFLLVAQHDHALVSGRFASRVGAGGFARPEPFEKVIDGVGLHDCGWPLHDERPTLNAKGLPLHVLETPMPLAIRVWSESARRASEKDPYSGLLVSLHVMALSFIAQTLDPTPHERFRDARDLFDLNKFQHRQAELQEELRRRVGLRTDIPLNRGLAKPGVDPDEDRLLFHYNLLKLCDRLSLDLCCSEPLFETVEGVYPSSGAEPVTLKVGHVAESAMTLAPWPFDADRLEHDVPCRRVPATPFPDDDEFRQAFEQAPRESLRLRLSPG
jgi:hypothetical protein